MVQQEDKVQEKATGKSSLAAAALAVLKIVLVFLLVPVVVASTAAIFGEILRFDPRLQRDLLRGVLVYLVLFFFVYDFSAVYRFGQGVTAVFFQFLKPLLNFAPYVIPIYTVIVLVVFAILNATGHQEPWKGICYSLMAATFLMHMVLTARDLYEKDSAPGKPTYFFGMQTIYIVDVFFIALVMHTTLPGFSFVRFFQSLAGTTFHIYKAVFAQLFL